MSFSQINVNKFAGLNSTIDPSLIKDEEARDILNFRMEKVGKLVSRNGYITGLFTDIHTAAAAKVSVAGEERYAPTMCYFNNTGIIGLGEIILSEPWVEIDTDRLMVYIIRGMEYTGYSGYSGYSGCKGWSGYSGYSGAGYSPYINDSCDEHIERRNQECYLFSPLTGIYKNTLLTNHGVDPVLPASVTIVNKRKWKPYDTNDEIIDLMAPNREVPSYWEDGVAGYDKNDNDHWIKNYIDMHQYQHKMVISDPINGDMILEDEYDYDKSVQQCETPTHKLVLRPNVLETFEIDYVDIDPRLEENQENDASASSTGVEHGMALYGYELPEKNIQITKDYFSKKISNLEWLGVAEDGNFEIGSETVQANPTKRIIAELQNPSGDCTMIRIANWGSGTSYADSDGGVTSKEVDIWLNKQYNYVFSNEDAPGQFRDILGKLELPEDEYVDEHGVKQKDVASDVYIWEDLRYSYYPTKYRNGDEYVAEEGYFIRQIDRFFQKLSPGTPRITKLRLHKPPADSAPLGVWRYRFVWDFGNDEYSTPSAELLAPDVLWSASRDCDIFPAANCVLDGDYHRPQDVYGYLYTDDNPMIQDVLNISAPYNALVNHLTTPPLVYASAGKWKLNPVGIALHKLKTEIYELNHRYGAQATIANFENYSTADGAQTLLAGQFGCSATMRFAEFNLPLKGFIWEGVAYWDEEQWASKTDEWWLAVFRHTVAQCGSLYVPIFKNNAHLTSGIYRAGNPTYNSIFDDEGKCRLAYQRTDLSKNYLIFPGANPCIGSKVGNSLVPYIYNGQYIHDSIIFVDMVTGEDAKLGKDANVYYNLICIPEDHDNYNDPAIMYLRNNTLLRAVKNDQDRLLWTKPDIDTEALRRLILGGTAEIHICKNGEKVYATSSCLDVTIPLDEWLSLPGDATQGYWTETYLSDVDNNLGLTSNISGGLNPVNTGDIDNLDIYIYGEGERFTGIEQLTAYFPSSLLFGAPRLAIKIPHCAVPKRAKRLLVFRTLSSHDNNFDPLNYAFVKAVPIGRSDGTSDVDKDTSDVIPLDEAFTDYKHKNDDNYSTYRGIYYFDEVRDADLDFGDNPLNYEGLRNALKSSFNIPLNENMYYLNFTETYQPMKPRKEEYGLETPDPEKCYNTMIKIGDSTDTNIGYKTTTYVKYKYVYVDRQGIKSKEQWNGANGVDVEPPIVTVTVTNVNQIVVLYFVPSGYDYSIETNTETNERVKRENGQVQIYRATSADNNVWTDYFYIGAVGGGDQGIFMDDNSAILHEKLECTCPLVEHYESGLRHSERGRPDWIKAANFAEYKAGDGKQATGIQSQYGNLVIFKETSMYRVAVQAKNPPLSRTDEISPEIGCIAPNTLINVNNNLYFLSWKGFMSFDNNQLKKIDGPFDEELQFVMTEAGDKIRDASCGYNPAYNEIYLNIPMPDSKYDTDGILDDGRVYDAGNTPFHRFERSMYGHVYVVNLEKGYSTKFSYVTSLKDPVRDDTDETIYIKEDTDTRQFIRKYYTNSLGELRSADIFPSTYGSIQYDSGVYEDGFRWAGIYIETPYQEDALSERYKDIDRILDGRAIAEYRTNGNTIQVIIQDDTTGYQFHDTVFPATIDAPIRVAFKSKFFTGDDESMVKRVRKGLAQMYSRGEITIKGITIPYESADERIDNLTFDIALQEFKYNPSISTALPLTNITLPATNRSILCFIPQDPYGMWGQHDGKNIQTFNDFIGKPLRFSIEIESTCRTQINEIAIHWRGINKYLA